MSPNIFRTMPTFEIGQAIEHDIAMPVSFGPSKSDSRRQMDYSTSTSTGTWIDAALVIERWETDLGAFTSLWEYGPNYWPADWDGDFSGSDSA